MDIRNEIESYITFFAPKGVIVITEEKANLFFLLSWPKAMKIPSVSIMLKFNFEEAFEREGSQSKRDILTKISSYLDRKFKGLETSEGKGLRLQEWDVSLADVTSDSARVLALS